MYWKRKRVAKERETYELVYPVTIRRVTAALVIAYDIATDLLVVVVVGVQTRYDHTPVRTLGR